MAVARKSDFPLWLQPLKLFETGGSMLGEVIKMFLRAMTLSETISLSDISYLILFLHTVAYITLHDSRMIPSWIVRTV